MNALVSSLAVSVRKSSCSSCSSPCTQRWPCSHRLQRCSQCAEGARQSGTPDRREEGKGARGLGGKEARGNKEEHSIRVWDRHPGGKEEASKPLVIHWTRVSRDTQGRRKTFKAADKDAQKKGKMGSRIKRSIQEQKVTGNVITKSLESQGIKVQLLMRKRK